MDDRGRPRVVLFLSFAYGFSHALCAPHPGRGHTRAVERTHAHAHITRIASPGLCVPACCTLHAHGGSPPRRKTKIYLLFFFGRRKRVGGPGFRDNAVRRMVASSADARGRLTAIPIVRFSFYESHGCVPAVLYGAAVSLRVRVARERINNLYEIV